MNSAAILVVGPSWVGDMVMAQSLFKTLRHHFPHLPIDVLAPEWSNPLLVRMPEVRRGVAMPLGHGVLGLGERYRLGKGLRGAGYQRAYLLPNSWKSALVPFFARIPQRIGYLGEGRWGVLSEARRLDKTRLPRTVDRFVALGLPEGAPLPDPLPAPALVASREGGAAALQRLHLTPGALVLCPGAEYGPAKQWPLDCFHQVAAAWSSRQRPVWVIGSHKEQPAGEVIADGLPLVVNLAGRTTLAEAVDLLALAQGVVTNDSGLMHVAAALERPMVAIFGSSDPRFTPPLSRCARVVNLGLACSPCFRRQCPEQHLACLRGISPAMVLDELEGLV